jgi:hypothetical protein
LEFTLLWLRCQIEQPTAVEAIVNAGNRWMVEIEPGQTAYPRQPNGFWTYMAAGPEEMLDATKYDWNWQSENTASGHWLAAASAIRESIYGTAEAPAC